MQESEAWKRPQTLPNTHTMPQLPNATQSKEKFGPKYDKYEKTNIPETGGVRGSTPLHGMQGFTCATSIGVLGLVSGNAESRHCFLVWSHFNGILSARVLGLLMEK